MHQAFVVITRIGDLISSFIYIYIYKSFQLQQVKVFSYAKIRNPISDIDKLNKSVE